MSTTPAVADVATGRALIDALDAQLAALVQQRIAVSREVQRLRHAQGVPGVQHARENQVMARYREALGEPGGRLALLLLRLCRGDAAAPAARSLDLSVR